MVLEIQRYHKKAVLLAIESNGGYGETSAEELFDSRKREFNEGIFPEDPDWTWWDNCHCKFGDVSRRDHKKLFNEIVDFTNNVLEDMMIEEYLALLQEHEVEPSDGTKFLIGEGELDLSELFALFDIHEDELVRDTDDETDEEGETKTLED